MKAGWIGVVVGLWLVAATASADVVGPGTRITPAPTGCPRGSQAIPGNHGRSAHCRPSECESAEHCMGSMAPCEEIGLCVAQGMTRGATFPIAARACESDADCEGVRSLGEEAPRCEVRQRCGGLPGPGHELGGDEQVVEEVPAETDEAEAEEDGPPAAEEPVVTPVARDRSGCGCRVPAPGAPASPGVIALLLGLALRARRSSRDRSPRRRSGARSRRSAPRCRTGCRTRRSRPATRSSGLPGPSR